jgi:hypothetical protein
VARIWGSLAFRDLRATLTEPEQEKLRGCLAAYMAGEMTPVAWHATVSAVAALRRASAVRAPQQGRQTWTTEQEW